VARNRSVSAVLGSSVPRPRPQPFPARNRSALRRRAALGALVLLSLVLITVSFREPRSGPLHGIQTAGATVLRPFEVAAERVARPFRDAYGWLHGLVNAKEENDALRAQVNQLRQEALQGQTARQENASLRDELSYVDSPQFPSDYSAVNTRILSWAASEFDQEVVIAAGSDRGIREDATIVTHAGLVGRVTDLTGGEAKVTLITDESSSVPALDVKTRARGLIRRGSGKGSLILDRVPKEADVRKGDLIVTAGTRSPQYPSLFPHGIQIGTVTSVGQSDTASYKQIQIEPFVDFSELDAVTALVTKKRTARAR
jgi:rod shape-determining protein MreC